MSRLLGHLLQQGKIAKLADDLYIGANTQAKLVSHWQEVLTILHKTGMGLAPAKTTIAPSQTTILGWIWERGTITASPHRVAVLSTCTFPVTVTALRSFVGTYKVLSRVLPQSSAALKELDKATTGKESKDKIVWTDTLTQTYTQAQQQLKNVKIIMLPRPSDQIWIVTDAATSIMGLPATYYVTRDGKPDKLLAGFFSARIRKGQELWLPCELEALSIATAVRYFAPYIIQSRLPPQVVTDSKACVQATQRMERGDFSTSPRITTFLATLARYQVVLTHLPGKNNTVSDFGSRHPAHCQNSKCQVCKFIKNTATASVRQTTLTDIYQGHTPLPYANRPAWKAIQKECQDLRLTHSMLKAGTAPSKKATQQGHVKRYLHEYTWSRLPPTSYSWFPASHPSRIRLSV